MRAITLSLALLFSACHPRVPHGIEAVNVNDGHGEPERMELVYAKGSPATLTGSLVNGRCSVCVAEGQTSTVEVGLCTRTLLGGSSGYDKDGKPFYDDPNWTTCDYTCSRGHRLTARFK